MIPDKEYKQKVKKQTPYVNLDLLSSRLSAYFLTLLEDQGFEDPRYSHVISFTKTAEKYLKTRLSPIEKIKAASSVISRVLKFDSALSYFIVVNEVIFR